MKKPTEKHIAKTIVLWVIFGILVGSAIAITVFANNIFGVYQTVVEEEKETIVTIIPSLVEAIPQQSNAFLQYVTHDLILHSLRSVQIIGFAVALAVAVHYLAKITIKSKKGLTISKLLVNFFKWAIAIATLFFVLGEWGADTRGMLISAGVVTLIIGLGSQSLVADILAGIFIVFEGEFQVGDIVIIDGWRGEIIQIGIRTTRLIDAGGNIKIVNNSEIKTIINQTQELSLAKCYVSLAYDFPIEKAEIVISENLDAIKERIPAIVEGPFYKGVSELAESSVDLLFVAKCKENDIYQVQRDLNREIKIMFDRNNVEIPFNQLVVHFADKDGKEEVSKKDERKARQFKEEQKELSKDLEIRNDN